MSINTVNLLTLPPEIQYSIGSYLSIKDISTARLICKYFATLFGDENFIWRIKYKPLGLGQPTILQSKIGKLTPSPLIKTLSIWTSFQKTIEEMDERDSTTLCIMVSLLPEFTPLHSYAIKVLKKLHNSPKKFSLKKLYLRVAKYDSFFKGNRILIIKSLQKIEKNSKTMQKIYLSILKENFNCDSNKLVPIAINGLMPFFSNSEVSSALLSTLENSTMNQISFAFYNFQTNPVIFNAIINRFKIDYGLYQMVCHRLNDPDVVNRLIYEFKTTNNYLFLYELIDALKPILNQIPVQEALCEKLSNLKPKHNYCKIKNLLNYCKIKNLLINTARSAELDDEIIEKYKKKIPILKQLVKEKKISQLSPHKDNHRKLLLKSLSNKYLFIRIAAAKALSPFVMEYPKILSTFLKLIKPSAFQGLEIIATNALVPFVQDNPKILSAFLKRINTQIFDDAATSIVCGLAKVANQKNVRMTLLNKGCLSGEIAPSLIGFNINLRLATIQTLQPFLEEPEVREAFFSSFERDEYPPVYNTLAEILAPHLDKEDVRSLFLKIAKNENMEHDPYYYPSQIAAVEKLGSIANIPEIQELLFKQLAKKNLPNLKAACIRALCSNKNLRLIDPKELLILCIDNFPEVRKAARHALKSWMYEKVT